jgi:hypothetical protein
VGDKLIVTPFEPWHIDALGTLSDEDKRWTVKEFPWLTYLDRVRAQAQLGPAFTGIIDGEVVGCCGIMQYWPGVGELWLVVSDQAPLARVRIIRALLRDFEKVAARHNLMRIQVFIPDGGETFSRRFVEKMGFVRETKDDGMRKFAMDGETCHLYAKVY